jgi:hypothetical protein
MTNPEHLPIVLKVLFLGGTILFVVLFLLNYLDCFGWKGDHTKWEDHGQDRDSNP